MHTPCHRITGGAYLEMKEGIRLYALGKPHDFRPGTPPGMHGESLGQESFHTPSILRSEKICGGGGVAVMRVGFVPQRIVTMDSLRAPIPGTKSWRLGSEGFKGDVFWVSAEEARAYNLKGVAFNAADSAFLQLPVYDKEDKVWEGSYIMHAGFDNIVPKAGPEAESLPQTIVSDLLNRFRGNLKYLRVGLHAGFGISPEWYGIGEDYVTRIRARYGDPAFCLRKPSAGPRKDNAHSLSLMSLLRREFEDKTKLFSRYGSTMTVDLVESVDSCPAAMVGEDGKPIFWSSVRESDKKLDPPGKPTARNYVFFVLPVEAV